MSELPDLVVYVERLRARVKDGPLERLRVANPARVRSIGVDLAEIEGRRVVDVARIGHRIVVSLEDALHVALRLGVVGAGRLRWRPPSAPLSPMTLAALDFPHGALLLANPKSARHVGIDVVRADDARACFDLGGVELLETTLADFRAALASKEHTLKRALVDPRVVSGLGSTYADEILFRARLSPGRLTTSLSAAEVARLFDAAKATLGAWIDRLRFEAADRVPEKVAVFREGMEVRGRHGEACSVCGARIRRIVVGETETFFCAKCQADDDAEPLRRTKMRTALDRDFAEGFDPLDLVDRTPSHP